MKTQFDHNLLSSFQLWIDDRLTRVAEGVITGKSQIFKYIKTNDTPSNFHSFYSSARQFSANSLLAPSSVYVSGQLVNQNTTGNPMMLIDHDQGRILLQNTVSTGSLVSGNFIQKEINVYVTNEREEDVILNKEFLVGGSTNYLNDIANDGGHKRYTIPAIFITYNNSNNEPFALGGTENTVNNVRIIAMANSNYLLDGMLSLFKDSSHKCFPLIDYSNFPYGKYWHVKNPPYSYTGHCVTYGGEKAYVEQVSTYKLKDAAQNKISKSVMIGFADFKISFIRSTN